MKEILKRVVQFLLGSYGNATKNIYVPPPKPPIVLSVPTKKIPDLKFNFGSWGSKSWKGVVVHHSATPDGTTRDADGIIKYHTSYRIDYKIVTKDEFERRKAIGDGKVFELPWKACGYHFMCEYTGKELVLIPGRPLWMVGAHAGHPKSNEFNIDYIGFCVIGNFDEALPPKEKFLFAAAVCKSLMKTFSFTREKVLGHRETFDILGVPREKMCPGKLWNMDEFRELL
jgi:hypothetical protein